MRKTHRDYRVLQMLLGFVLIAAVIVPTVGYADPPPAPDETRSPTGYGDDGRWEVGVEYVNYYPSPTRDVWRTDDTARGLYNQLGYAGWTRRFIYGNHWAWEEDWKVSWRGGTESIYVDSVDLALFAGHGGSAWDSYYGRWLRGPVFGDGGRNHDDPYLVPGDARRAWGNKDLEWVALHGCSILDDSSRRYWAASMYGLHLLLGYKTTAYDVDQGSPFGYRIRWRWKTAQAWFGATDVAQPHWGVVARVLANEPCHYYHDRWGWVCGDSYDWDYWYADHWAGSEQALLVDPADLNYEMPVLNVISPAPTEDYLNDLADAFGFSPNTPAILDDESNFYRIVEEPLDLTVDQQGMFYAINLDQLWSAPTGTLTVDMQPLTPADDAHQIAETFLTANDLLPPDAEFYEVISDTLSAAVITETPTIRINNLGATETYTEVQETISYTVGTAQQVIYSRHIVYTPTVGSPVTFSVQGPGARLKVYVSNGGQVIGAMGGWRTIDDQGILDTVQIITPTQMLHLYKELGNRLDLAPTPFLADVVTVTRSTVGYYEQPMGMAQTTLTPVYILDIAMEDTSSGDVLSSTAFIPAAPALMNPLAEITSYPENTPPILVGDTLTLTAADASQPLSTLGYGEDLTFALGEAPYTYTWRLGSTGEVIGTGQSITHTITFHDYANLGRDYDVPLPIILEVTDGAGRTSSSVRFFYFAETLPVYKIYLPLVTRH